MVLGSVIRMVVSRVFSVAPASVGVPVVSLVFWHGGCLSKLVLG